MFYKVLCNVAGGSTLADPAKVSPEQSSYATDEGLLAGMKGTCKRVVEVEKEEKDRKKEEESKRPAGNTGKRERRWGKEGGWERETEHSLYTWLLAHTWW